MTVTQAKSPPKVSLLSEWQTDIPQEWKRKNVWTCMYSHITICELMKLCLFLFLEVAASMKRSSIIPCQHLIDQPAVLVTSPGPLKVRFSDNLTIRAASETLRPSPWWSRRDAWLRLVQKNSFSSVTAQQQPTRTQHGCTVQLRALFKTRPPSKSPTCCFLSSSNVMVFGRDSYLRQNKGRYGPTAVSSARASTSLSTRLCSRQAAVRDGSSALWRHGRAGRAPLWRTYRRCASPRTGARLRPPYWSRRCPLASPLREEHCCWPLRVVFKRKKKRKRKNRGKVHCEEII